MVNGMQSFKLPEKLYFRQGCLPIALQELKHELQKKSVLIVTDDVMLHNGGITPVTQILHDLGLTYAVNNANSEPDCVIACGSRETWAHLPENITRIIIPTELNTIDTQAWLDADMVILDEDMISEEPTCSLTLEAAKCSLSGANASDYTLAWAVQAMRMVWNGDGSKSTLLHAAALSCLAYAAADGGEPSRNLFEEAAEALGITPEELKARLNKA